MFARRHLATLVTALLLVIALSVPAAGAIDPNTDGAGGPTVDRGSALVQLDGAPLSTYQSTKPPQGKKIDFDSSTVKSYRAQLSALRNDFKRWLRANAPKAKMTGEYDISLNAVALRLNGEALATIQSAPMVVRAEYQGLYYPTEAGVNDPDLALVNAVAAWGAGGAANAGRGVKVGVIDTGIDATHPCFNDAGYSAPAGFPKGDTRFTNNKVIVAKVFNNKVPSRGYTAEAVQEHGTHVAGTIACDYGLTSSTTTVDGVTVPYGVTGVAPAAWLGNYNVFPGTVGNARSEDILNALEAAYADGMDIINMSLGGGASGIQDLLTIAVDDLDEAGMISAVAAGNEGPGHYTVSSPGSAARALTAGAYSVGHGLVTFIGVGGTQYQAAKGDFGTPPAGGLTRPLKVVTDAAGPGGLSTACSAVATDLTGTIALISRGACTFSTKIRNAQSAGADGAIVVNNTAGANFTMSQDGTPGQPTIPAFLVALTDRAALIAADGAAATLPDLATYVADPSKDNWMASFSSQGPTDVDFRVKPDAAAPGVNVLSSIPRSFCAGSGDCWAFFQGTSMATPHLAGIAAVVRGQHPTWSAAQVRSAIVNTADQGVLKTSDGTVAATDPNLIGAGRANAASAVSASVALDPVSVSFGSVPSISGQTRTATISVSNLGGSADAVAVTGTTGSGITFGAALSGGTITVTMAAAKGASVGDHQATLRVLSGGSEVAHAVLYVFVKQ